MGHNILLTGIPGVGKTTLIIKILEWLRTQPPLDVRGFYTIEIREKGKRLGFEIITTQGIHAVLAHVDSMSRYKVGKYGVDISAFENTIIPLFPQDSRHNTVYVIDEIGKMECFSARFVDVIELILARNNLLIASIAMKGSGFINKVKEIPNTKIFTITLENRNDLFDRIIDEIKTGI